MFDWVTDSGPVVFALVIFGLRIINMMFRTLRTLAIVRKKTGIVFLIGLLQSSSFVLSMVFAINDLDNILNLSAYALGFATGNVIGMMIEERLAFGYVNLTIMSAEAGLEIAERLRAEGHAVTEILAHGKDGDVTVLESGVEKKFTHDIQDIVLEIDPAAFITSRNIQPLASGFWHV
jgi:uncharacterized protein YebE (UPF0316 family)